MCVIPIDCSRSASQERFISHEYQPYRERSGELLGAAWTSLTIMQLVAKVFAFVALALINWLQPVWNIATLICQVLRELRSRLLHHGARQGSSDGEPCGIRVSTKFYVDGNQLA